MDPDSTVVGFRSCLDEWPLFVGEIYTIVPNPVDAGGEPVACANVTYASDNPDVATVTSWGEVEARQPGVANIAVKSGGAFHSVTFTVAGGERFAVTDVEWDQAHPSRCAVPADVSEKLASIDDGDDLDAPDAAIPGNETGSPNLRAMEYSAQSSIRAKTNFGSSNYSFAAPVLSLGGRELGIDLMLAYNGQPWQKDVVGGTTKMTFNYGKGWPAAGWRLGFGRIIAGYDPSKPNNRLLIQPDGTKIVLRYDTSTSPAKCLSEDGTFLEYSPQTGKLKYPNGTIVNYNLHFNNRWLPVSIQSPNGNIVTISYKPAGIHPKGSIDVITDTLGRTVTFHYYGDSTPVGDTPPPADPNNPQGALYSVRVEDRGFVPGGPSNKREIVRLSYTNLPAFPSGLFNGSYSVDAPSTSRTAVAGIYYPATGTGYTFDYASVYGMATTVHVRKDMTTTTDGVDVARTTYAFPATGASLNNLPRFSSRTEWRDDGNGGGIASTWNYANNSGGATAPSTYTVTAASASPDVIVTRTTVGYPGHSDGLATTTEIFRTGVTGQLMRKVVTTYDFAPDDAESIWTPSNGGSIVDTVITTNESGERTKIDYDYSGGSFGQVTKIEEFDDFAGGGFTKRRISAFTYFDTWSTSNYKQNLFYLVSQATLTDPIPSPVVKSRTDFAYDVYSGNLKAYLSSPPAGTRDSTFDNAAYRYRGNLTSVTRYRNAAAGTGAITKNSYFDVFGNIERADVSCCTQKTFTYQGLADGTGLYFSVPTSVTDGPTGGLNLTRSAKYDFANGNVLRSTDERGHEVTATHDAAWRLKTVTIPSFDNGTSRNVVRTMNYDVGSPGKDQLVRNEVLTYWDNGAQRTITDQVWMDGQGLVVRRGTSPASSGSFDAVRMTYDAIGRMTASTNPYAGNSSGNPTGTTYSTAYAYDALSRTTTATLPDGDTISTTYTGKTTTVTDQVGRQRRTVVDGLGRIVTVYEQNPVTGGLDWTTANVYDVFDNVTDVKMYLSGSSGAYQQRTATYDGLSRLTARTTPEVNNQTGGSAGTPVTETYTYTDFDAVDVYTDGRGATIDYGFDTLNRMTSIVSAPASGDPDTHDIVITYETFDAMKKGLVTSVTDYSEGETAYGQTFAYENNRLGRLQSWTRTIGLASQTGGRRSYQVSYTYNSIGQELTMTYPSGLAVRMGRDNRGRLNAVTNGASLAKYASGVTYNSAGLVEGLTINDNGAAVKLVEDYNYSPGRLQLTNQSVTKASSGAVLMNFNYSYEAEAGASGLGTSAGNSGQLMAVASGSTLNGLGAAQRFTYDTVGRLETSTGSAPGATNKGTDTIGTYVASSSTFFLRNSNSPGAADVTAGYGPPPSTWVPIRGDWDGDGADSIGLYDPATSTFYLKNTNSPGSADLAFAFGAG
ncbi:MAG: RHS repeat protein, partial [Acidobacteria bacterium]|nr:RHS repeat protein [Acidobacteriota bacterium]